MIEETPGVVQTIEVVYVLLYRRHEVAMVPVVWQSHCARITKPLDISTHKQ